MSFDFQNHFPHFSIVDWSYTETLEPLTLDHYERWVKSDEHGSLGYLADHRKDLRSSLKKVFPAAQSALVFLFSYEGIVKELKKIEKDSKANGLKLASYTLGFGGEDYHLVLGSHLQEIGSYIQKLYPNVEYQMSLDIHPVLERDLAYRSGLGFFGKNSMLISTEHGSYFLIGSLILSQKVEAPLKRLETDHCGQCTRCVDACPTSAIDGEKRTILADQCLSTYTIEMFKETAPIPKGALLGRGEIFGCDICQDVCPWNQRRFRLNLAQVTKLSEKAREAITFFMMRPKEDLFLELSGWSNKYFKKYFKQTSYERTGRPGLLKNIKLWLDKKI